MTRPAFVAPRRPLRSTIHDMADMSFRALERFGRDRAFDAAVEDWRRRREADPRFDEPEPRRPEAADRAVGLHLTTDELTELQRATNEARADLRAGATLAEAWAAAGRPTAGLGDEEPPVAPWFDAPPPAATQRDDDGEYDGEDGVAAPEAAPAPAPRRPFVPTLVPPPAGAPLRKLGRRRKLDAAKVAAICADWTQGGLTITQISAKYGISRSLAHGVCKGVRGLRVVAAVDPALGPDQTAVVVASRTADGATRMHSVSHHPTPAAAPAPALPTISHQTPSKEAPMGVQSDAQIKALQFFRKHARPVTRDELEATGIWPPGRGMGNWLHNATTKGFVTVLGGGKYELTKEGLARSLSSATAPAAAPGAAKVRKKPGAKHGSKRRAEAGTPFAAASAAMGPVLSGKMTLRDAIEQLRQEVAAKQSAIAALEALIGS